MIKIVLPILVFGLLAGCAKAADSDDRLPPPSKGKTWKLVWHDEFDGDKLDDSKWDVPDHKRRDGWPKESNSTFSASPTIPSGMGRSMS